MDDISNLTIELKASFNEFKSKILDPCFCQKFLIGDSFLYNDIVKCINKQYETDSDIEEIMLDVKQTASRSPFWLKLIDIATPVINLIKKIRSIDLEIKTKEIEIKRAKGEFDPPIYDAKNLDAIDVEKITKVECQTYQTETEHYNTPSLTRCINFFILDWEPKYYSKHLIVKHKNKLYTNKRSYYNINYKNINELDIEKDIYKVEPDQDTENIVWSLVLKEDIQQFYTYCKKNYDNILNNKINTLDLDYFYKIDTLEYYSDPDINKVSDDNELYEYNNSSNEFSNNLIDNIIDNLSTEHIHLLIYKLNSFQFENKYTKR